MPIEALENFQGNLKTLDPEQEAKARQSIIKHGFTFPVFIWGNRIIDGHQRLFVVRKMLKDGYAVGPIPVDEIEAKDEKEAAEKLLVLNSRYGRITEDGMSEFIKNFKLDLSTLPEIHIPEIDFSALFENPAGLPDDNGPSKDIEDESPYSRKIEAPIYVPSGPCPEISDLINEVKTKTLKAEIEKANIPANVKEFLSKAADRHTVFDFSKIANYYAHAPADVQDLMEKSALIIIDFDKAIEYGFVKLTEAIAEQYGKDYPNDEG